MEAAGVAVGVAPLIGLCLDVLDRIRDFKGYESSSLQLNARFEVAKSRLRQWASTVGVDNDKLLDPHHDSLDQPEVNQAVGIVLNCLLNNFGGSIEDAEVTLADRHRQSLNVPPGWRPIQRKDTGTKRMKTGHFRRNALLWATGHKAAFAEQVDVFEILVGKLYEVIPLDNTERALKSATKALEQFEVTHEEFLALIKRLHRDALLKRFKLIDDWLDTPSIDQDHEKHVDARLQGTCDWLFTNNVYISWETNSFPNGNAKLFWLHGPVGHGKTVLAATLTQNMITTKSSSTAYFFSSPQVQSEASPHIVVRSWISQLARTEPRVFELAYNRLAASATNKVTTSEAWRLLRDIALIVDECTLILDGLDEFTRLSDGRRSFLRQLKEHIAGTKSRVFLSSRSETDIEAELAFPRIIAGLSLLGHRITSTDVKADVVLYTSMVVSEQLPGKDQKFQQELADVMVSKCDGMFLWVKLQIPELRDGKSKAQLREAVNELPDGLSQSYARTWTDIMSNSNYDRRRAIEILRWVCFAIRPLTVAELTEALAHEHESTGSCEENMPDQINDNYIDGEIKGLCGSFVDVPKGLTAEDEETPLSRIVRLVHLSAKQFIVARLPPPLPVAIRSPESSEHGVHHVHLAEVCLRYLNCDASWKHSTSGPPSDQSPFKNTLMNYAALKWYTHQREAGMVSDEYRRLTSQFFAPDNLHFRKWIKFDVFYQVEWTNTKTETGLNALLYVVALFELSHVADHLCACDKLDFSPTTFSFGAALSVAALNQSDLFERFISWGADINLECGRDGSALGTVVTSRDLQRARLLLDLGADPKIRDWKRRPILTLACWNDDLDMMRLLLEHGFDPSDCDDVVSSPLFWCIKRGNSETVKLLLDHGASVSLVDEHGRSALHYACTYGSAEIVNLLLDKGADLLLQASDRHTPLHEASNAGRTDIIASLFERKPDLLKLTGPCDPDSRACIHYAATSGSVATMQVLVDYGADIKQVTDYGMTALHFACTRNDNVEAVEFLLAHGVDIMSRDQHSWTPLHEATFHGLPKVTKTLLERGADMNAESSPEDNRSLPIHHAARSKSTETLRILLDHGADVNATMAKGRSTPLHVACFEGTSEMINCLINEGADLMQAEDSGRTPLHMACESELSGMLDAVSLLLRKGVDVHQQAKNGLTALHSACSNTNVLVSQVIDLLLNRGANITQSLEGGITPLHLAAQSGSLKVVQLLLKRGAQPPEQTDPSANSYHLMHFAVSSANPDIVQLIVQQGFPIDGKARLGWTPLRLAIHGRQRRIVEMLMDAGADVSTPIYHGHTPIEDIGRIWPNREQRRQQQQSKIASEILVRGRESLLKQEISNAAQDALLVEQFPHRDKWAIFTYMAINFWRLRVKDDFTFASQQTLRLGVTNGPVSYIFICDGCNQNPIVEEHWLCFTCPVSHAQESVDYCGTCKAQICDPQNAEPHKCSTHDLVLMPCYEGNDIEKEDDRAKDPEVRKWLERIVAQYSVDGPLPAPQPAVLTSD